MKLEVVILLDGKEISRTSVPVPEVSALAPYFRPELPVHLTPTELKIAKLTLTGMSSRDMAHELRVSESHIDNVRSSIRQKLNLDRSQGLAQELAKYQLPS
jgi:DNA-binding CsgD family transcriptional regulator